jgi:very-short-patch-repair endonuclease
MVRDERWRRTLKVLRAQGGAARRRQLLDLGWTDAMVANAVAAGLLERDHLGTYALSTSRTGVAQHLATSVLAAGSGAALTSISAGRLYGLHGLPRDERVHVLVPHERVVQRPDPTLVVRRSRIPDPTSRLIAGMTVTGPARTVIELGRDLDVAQLVEVLAHALHERVVNTDALEAEIARCARTRGLPTVRAALARLAPDDSRARARRERSTARLLQAHGLPRPRLGHVVELNAAAPVELDLAYPEVLLGIEVDGIRWHRTPQQKRYDEVRQNRLTAAGWGVLRFGEQQLDHTPNHVVRAVRAALLQREHPAVTP